VKGKSTKLVSMLLAIVILTGTMIGCTKSGTEPTTKQITNLDGTAINVSTNITRVACLYGPSYEKVVILGAEDKIVLAMNQSSVWPWTDVIYKRTNEVTMLPGSGASTPNIEELLSRQIQLVFFWQAYTDPIKKMSDVGIPCIIPNEAGSAVLTFDDTKALLKVYAQALGKDAEKKADEYCKYFDEKKALITSRTKNIPESERPTVYYAVRKPLQTAGKNSNVPELVSLAGGICVTKDLDAGFGKDIVIEQLIAWDPEFIVLDHCGASYLGSAPADQILADIAKDVRFKDMAAVKSNQVYMSPTGVFFWDTGQQMILQLMWLAKLLHPDQFQDIDMAKEVKEFYSKFFDYNLTDDEVNRILQHLPPASN
jgi:iron complex transport system substrate-binding protein